MYAFLHTVKNFGSVGGNERIRVVSWVFSNNRHRAKNDGSGLLICSGLSDFQATSNALMVSSRLHGRLLHRPGWHSVTVASCELPGPSPKLRRPFAVYDRYFSLPETCLPNLISSGLTDAVRTSATRWDEVHITRV